MSDVLIELKEHARFQRWEAYISAASEVGASDVHNAIKAIFLLFNALVYPESDLVSGHKEMMKALEQLFDNFLVKYRENAEFLFFVGYFMALSEWAFGREDFELSHRMLLKAWEIEPSDLLYEWGYKFSIGDPEACKLAERLCKDVSLCKRLSEVGQAGDLIAEAIKTNHRHCQSGQFGSSVGPTP